MEENLKYENRGKKKRGGVGGEAKEK